MTALGNSTDKKNFNKSAQIAINVISIIYVAAKLTYLFVAEDSRSWMAGIISGLLMLAAVILLNNHLKLSKRMASILLPSAVALIETVTTLATGGDGVYFFFLAGTVALSFIYVDSIGLIVYILIANAMAVVSAFVLKYPILYPGAGMHVVVTHYVSFLLMSATIYVICFFSVGRYREFADMSRTYDLILSSTPDFMVITDQAAKVKYISDSLVGWLGLEDRSYVLDRRLTDLFPSDGMKGMLSGVMESDGYVEKNFELTIDGKRCWYVLRSSMLGESRAARFWEWSDVTPLVEAKNAAEFATKAKGKFLAKMSHEIRTPMNAISGMVELILREDVSTRVREHAQSIKSASANLLSIINDILDYSKIESGKLEIVPAEYTFSSLINDVVNIIRIRIKEKPLQFSVNIDSSIPNVMIGDEVRVRQILLNLLSNAVKYTPRGIVRFNVTGRVEKDVVTLTAEVSDTGIGIKKEDVDRMFEDFVQLGMTPDKNVQGTGLGLAITKDLCKAMGGSIRVSSVYGEGSTFTAVIPQRFEKYQAFAQVSEPEAKRTLIYETRRELAASLKSSFDNLGVKCDVASSRKEFFEALGGFRYPYVFVPVTLFEQEIAHSVERGTELVLMSEYGETAFESARTLSMPAHTASIANILNDAEESPGFKSGGKSGIRFSAPTARILVVDDIKTNLMVAEGLMSPYNMTIDVCLSGERAVEMAAENRYDLVFMDHMMPGMDGIEAAGAIRALEDGSGYYKKLPIIALTANAAFGAKNVFLKNGLNDFLSKPIETQKLNNILEQWIPADKKEPCENIDVPEYGDIALEIDGIDVRSGVESTGGNLEVYMRTLTVFQKDCESKVNEIAASLRDGDKRMYTTLVHAVKSAAAGVGAARVSNMAKELEAASKRNDTRFVAGNTDKFLTELKHLAGDIRAAVESKRSGEDGPVSDSDMKLVKDDMARLKTAIESMDAGAIDVILSRMRVQKWGGEIRDVLENIGENVLMFEFERALECIDSFMEGR